VRQCTTVPARLLEKTVNVSIAASSVRNWSRVDRLAGNCWKKQ